MSSPVQSSLEQLKAAVRNGKVVPFVGAGVSMNVTQVLNGERVRFPNWKEFLESAFCQIEQNGARAAAAREMLEEGRYEDAASEARKKFESGEWYRLLRNAFYRPAEPKPEGLELAQALWGLGSDLVITTNYDHALEWARPGAAKWIVEAPYSQGEYLAGDALASPTVWHLHGDAEEPASIILTSEDYARLYPKPGLVRSATYEAALQTLRHVVAARSLLFVGFSGDDGAVGSELGRILTLFQGGTRKHFMLVRERDIDAAQVKVHGLGIGLVTFRDFGEPLIAEIRSLARVRPAAAGAPPAARPRPRSNWVAAPDDAPFLFRDEQLREVRQAISDPECRGAMLWGSHGTGKSVLADRVARMIVGKLPEEEEDGLADAFDSVVWVSMQSTSSKDSILGVYREVARTVGRSELLNIADDAQLAAELRSLLDGGNRMLLVVDALEDGVDGKPDPKSPAGGFRRFLERIPPSSFALVTMPIVPGHWPGYRRVQVPPWQPAQSLEYLRQMRRWHGLPDRSGEDEMLREAAADLPKALFSGFQLLAEGMPIEEVVAELTAPNGEVFKLRALQMEHLDRLGWIVAAAADLFTGSADLEWIRNSTGLDSRSFQAGLRWQAQPEERGGRKYLSRRGESRGAIAEYLKSRKDPLEVHAREMAVRGTFRFFRRHADWENKAEHRQALSEQLDNLRHLVQCALDLRRTTPEAVEMQDLFDLASGVAYLLHVEGAWQEAERLLRDMLERLDESTRLADRPLGVKVRALLGRHYAHVEDAGRALPILDDALERARRLEDRSLEAEVLMRKGHALHRLRPEEALRLLTEAIDMCAGHPERNSVRIAASGYLAAVQIARGEHDDALATLDAVRSACHAEIAPRIEAHHDRLRGDAYAGKDDLARARGFYQRSAESSRAWSDWRLHAWNLLGLAQCDRDPAQAREALEIFQKLTMSFDVERAERVLDALGAERPASNLVQI